MKVHFGSTFRAKIYSKVSLLGANVIAELRFYLYICGFVAFEVTHYSPIILLELYSENEMLSCI